MNKNLNIFLTFLKIGLTTFGGGYAMISNIKEEIVDKKKWLTNDELLEIVAISESTPGPIAINMATFVGYKQNKFLGSLLATLGVVLPSFIIILLIAFVLSFFLENKFVQYAFMGIKAGVAFLILRAAIKLIKDSKFKWWQLLLLFSTTITMVLLDLFAVNFSSIFLILIGAFIGLLIFLIGKAKKKENKEEEIK